ncbi:divalent cation tolerance protein CutA [Nonomuraea sp. M3C6]|uniref:Divalent cation tolerance protein CutA n=1 Tax=Nonomuraea marmarensis TaxID=3351344 RepID=A0ABW7AAX9_9ACTN
MAEFIEVHITIEGHEKASRLAHSLLHTGLAASIDIGEVTRLIRRENGIEEASAWQLAVITTASQLAAIEQHVGENHRDEEIPILALPTSSGNQAQLDWLRDQANRDRR